MTSEVARPEDDALAEQLLVLRAQMGARDAYGPLVERYDARLLFYLRRLVGPSADAEDVRQNVWLTVVRKIHTLENPAAFRTWLYRVARNHGLSWLRKRRPEIPLDDAGPLEEPVVDESDEGPGFGPGEAAAMYTALETLSRSHREVLTLRFLSGLTYDEIAAVLDCRVGTVRSRIHYAKSALRAAMSSAAKRGDHLPKGDVHV